MSDRTLDHATLAKLAEDVGHAATAGVIDRFLESLPQRVRRLRTAMIHGDDEEAHVAALSLSSSAAMLGAHPLAAAATAHVQLLSARVWESELVELARRTCAELHSWRAGVSTGADA